MSEEEKKIEKPNEIVDIVEKILKFNQQIQQGHGLKMLIPNQMLSRLPIALAQLNARNNMKHFKTKLDKYYVLCTDQKSLQNKSTKV